MPEFEIPALGVRLENTPIMGLSMPMFSPDDPPHSDREVIGFFCTASNEWYWEVVCFRIEQWRIRDAEGIEEPLSSYERGKLKYWADVQLPSSSPR